MERYLGLDVHAASCTLAVISQAGQRLTDFPIETNGQALVEAIRRIPGHKHRVFDEGVQSSWLYETLCPPVDEVVVAGVSESRGQKSDKRDAYGLAEKLRTGSLDKRISKAPREFSTLRELSRASNHVLEDLFKGAATTVIAQRDKDPIYAGYQRMLEGAAKPNLAKLTLARTIAATVLSLWKHEEVYRPEQTRRSTTTDRDA